MKEGKPVRVMVERLRRGEDVLDRLNQLVRENGVTAASFTALGAVEKASVGFSLGVASTLQSLTTALWKFCRVSGT